MKRRRPPPEVALFVNGKRVGLSRGTKWTILLDTTKRSPVHRHLRKMYVRVRVESRPARSA